MKKIILISFIFLTNLVFSQSLFYYWHIDKVVINNTTYDAPVNEENVYILLSIIDYKNSVLFFNTHCGDLDSYDMYFDQNTIDLGEFTYSISDCNINENNKFRDLHYSVYLNDSDRIYNYELSINQDGYEELIIINEFGDEAHYIDTKLNISDNIYNSVSIFPNPTNDILYFINDNMVIENLIVFNLSGQKLMEFKNKVNTLDVSTLQSGIYFFRNHYRKRKDNRKVYNKKKALF